MTTTHKFAVHLPVSEEYARDMLAMKYGPPFTRLVASRTETPPTEQQWAEYREAADLLAKLEANPCFYVGGYDCEIRIDEPAPTVHVEYAETEDEWAARVRTLNPDDYEPIMSRFLRTSMQAFAKESN